MCLAVPARVVSLLPDSMAVVEIHGASRTCCLMMLEGEVGIGSYVLLHAGFAIERVDPEEAERTLSDLRAMDAFSKEEVDGA